jgi:RNA polymerase sporulation-specific sigma factor
VNVQQLIEDNINLVYYVIHEYYPTSCKDEDIVQTGMVGLCYAANHWDEEKSSFSTFAVICIRSAINKEFRARNKHNGILSLEYEYSDSEGETNTIGDTLVGEEDVPFFDVDTFVEKLNPNDQEVFDLLMKGFNGVQIANKIGISPQRAHQQVRRLRKVWGKFNEN